MPYKKSAKKIADEKMSTMKHRTDTAHGHADDLIAAQKPNEASMDEYGIASSKFKGAIDPDSMVARSKATAVTPGASILQKRSGFRMKYQGNPTAFPFKSPVKHHQRNEDGSIQQHSKNINYDYQGTGGKNPPQGSGTTGEM